MRRAALALTCLGAACREEPPPPVFELRSVVAPALARLEAQLAPAEADAAGDAGDAREAFEAILGPLRSGDPDYVALALEDATRLPPAAVELVARALLDPAEAPAMRVALADVLGLCATPRALEALLDGLETTDLPALRVQCAYRLGQAGDDRVVPRLILRLKYEKDLQTVYWLVDALARFGHLDGLEPLVVVWSRAEGELREHAAARLGELAAEHGCASVDELRTRRREGRLASRATPSPALLLEGWRWIGRLGEWQLRGVDDARYVLVALEDWIVPLLAETLHEENVHVRLHAAQCLERRGRRAAGASAELEAALADPRIAPAAAAALGSAGAVAAAPALERATAASPDPELRVAAARALGVLGLARSRPVLEALLAGAPTLDLRQAAAQSLLLLDPAHEALALMHACLTDERADAGAAEVALGAWLTARAESEAAFAKLLARWNALAPEPGTVPGASEVAERRRARAELLRARVPGP